jgi:hypothetical protein
MTLRASGWSSINLVKGGLGLSRLDPLVMIVSRMLLQGPARRSSHLRRAFGFFKRRHQERRRAPQAGHSSK